MDSEKQSVRKILKYQKVQSQLEDGELQYELYGCTHLLVGSLGEIEEERMRASEA